MSLTLDACFPQRRQLDLVETEVGTERLVFDEVSRQLHSLDSQMTAIWKLCDGTVAVADMVNRTGINVEGVRHGVQQLDRQGLLQEAIPVEQGVASGLSRRRALKRTAMVAAFRPFCR